ncbi:transposase [Halomonas sp. QHL1]|uniref:transposase n=1 Tax=Halomonas sp. QHL1 TaxID=1123773 RepID=UPI0008FD2E94|nr:transposase [Halomonas sp. QHL1]OJA04311.1 hypothetical protein QHL1GM_02270 [Halomonas sp. QHL1]
MARNPIQFQSGLSLPAFLEHFGTEAQCQAALLHATHLPLTTWFLAIYLLTQRKSGIVHDCHITGGGRASVENPEFNWVNTLLGNVKNAITGTYHAIRGQHALRYLAEFEYRFNRRYDLKAIIPRFLTVAARTPPMPHRFLKMADSYA